MSLLNFCEQLVDPRIERNKEHTLEVIIYISLAAVICGADSWNEIERFGLNKFSFFQNRFPYLKKIPSHDTFNRFFSLLKPDYFELVFRSWVCELCGKYEGIVAIDGKTIRRASKCDKNNPTGKKGFKLHMVSAWAVANHLSLGQVKVDDKSNEITAIPALITALDLKDCIVTIDAIACQRDIAEAIIDAGADYVLALKGNQKRTLEKAASWLDGMDHLNVSTSGYNSRYARYITEEVSHGRIETRECFVFTPGNAMELMLDEKFKGVKSVVRITSERLVMASKESSKETRYYITSIKLDAAKIANAIRSHWAIENNLHWQLDVTFGEDAGRKVGNAAQNFSLVNKMALQIIKKDDLKASIKEKRKSAGWDEKYLAKLLNRANL